MHYRVHKVEASKHTEVQETLEDFLNALDGEIVSVVPYVAPTFRPMGATAKVSFLLVVERVV